MPKLPTVLRAGAALLLAAFAAPAPAVIISAGAGLGTTTDWAGVGQVGSLSSFFGTGTLVSPTHILTAAHLVDGLNNNQARFRVGNQNYTSASIVVHPNYDGGDQYDLAVITLAQPVANATYYLINDGSLDELTAGPGIKVGFGLGGSGTGGANDTTYPYGTKRAGANAIDLVTTTATNLTSPRGSITAEPGLLAYDFDDHTSASTGPLGGAAVGSDEANTTGGDSGGPMFQWSAALNAYLITGITVNGIDDLSRFGDISLDVRVADNAAWLSQQVPESGALAFVGLSACGLAVRRRRR